MFLLTDDCLPLDLLNSLAFLFFYIFLIGLYYLLQIDLLATIFGLLFLFWIFLLLQSVEVLHMLKDVLLGQLVLFVQLVALVSMDCFFELLDLFVNMLSFQLDLLFKQFLLN